MNVLSLFDGISCGRLVLERAGIVVDSYFASEVDESAVIGNGWTVDVIAHIFRGLG
jgi:site-specific DNA-cytosine methylase